MNFDTKNTAYMVNVFVYVFKIQSVIKHTSDIKQNQIKIFITIKAFIYSNVCKQLYSNFVHIRVFDWSYLDMHLILRMVMWYNRIRLISCMLQ